jgi:hypothetical protein
MTSHGLQAKRTGRSRDLMTPKPRGPIDAPIMDGQAESIVAVLRRARQLRRPRRRCEQRGTFPTTRTRRFRQSLLAVFDRLDSPVPATAGDTSNMQVLILPGSRTMSPIPECGDTPNRSLSSRIDPDDPDS